MRKKWENPNFNALGVELTESTVPTAYYIMTGGPVPTYDWTCSCCGDKKGGFASDELAKEDFNNNHAEESSQNRCTRWNYEIDACTIS